MMGMITPWVGRLLLANILVFFVTGAYPPIADYLAYFAPRVIVRPWTVLTYMFVHAGFGHLFGNMLGLFIFGPRLEERLGSANFLWMYFVAGAVGALLQTIFVPLSFMVGASGGVYGVLLGFALFWPRDQIIVFPLPIPVEARVLVAVYLVLSIGQGFGSVGNGVAHFAHLGGAAGAFGYLRWIEWRRGSARRAFREKLAPRGSAQGAVGDRVAVARWKGISVESLHELNRGEVERLLRKIDEDGPQSLTDSERSFLDRMSRS